MTTFNDIIAQALKVSGVLGVGQVASAEDVIDAQFHMNLMLDEWAVKRFLVYHLIDVSHTGSGSATYTVGTGGNFNTPRPDNIESAFLRLITPGSPDVDYPLEIIEAREDYNRITLKSLQSWPQAVFYDAAYPTGTLYVWPVPTSQYQIHITVKAQIAAVTDLTANINLPRGYAGALTWNLAARLRPNYQLAPDPSIVAFAKDALATVRQSNASVPLMTLPSDLVGHGGVYNVYSDSGG